MPKPFNPADLPADIVRLAESQVAAGRFASVEEVLRAGVEAIAREDSAIAAEEATWQRYRARGAADPRDLTAAEALACLNSSEPAQHEVLAKHVEALRDDLRAGKGLTATPAELMAGIRSRLAVPSA